MNGTTILIGHSVSDVVFKADIDDHYDSNNKTFKATLFLNLLMWAILSHCNELVFSFDSHKKLCLCSDVEFTWPES